MSSLDTMREADDFAVVEANVVDPFGDSIVGTPVDSFAEVEVIEAVVDDTDWIDGADWSDD
jgi:hypothetical protein